MGSLFSLPERNVICVGLDASGKSTILNTLTSPSKRVTDISVTVGFSLQKFQTDNVRFTVFDMSGSGKYRSLWEHYYSDVKGIIFVVDAADLARMDVVKKELFLLLGHPDIRSKPIPILFYANKKDLLNALDVAELSKILDLPRITDRPITIIPTNALKGEGLNEGAKWLGERMLEIK